MQMMNDYLNFDGGQSSIVVILPQVFLDIPQTHCNSFQVRRPCLLSFLFLLNPSRGFYHRVISFQKRFHL